MAPVAAISVRVTQLTFIGDDDLKNVDALFSREEAINAGAPQEPVETIVPDVPNV